MGVEFLCLANSRKGGGRCVAGVVPGRGWVRPVPDAGGSAVPTMRSKHFGLLDVVTADLATAVPLRSQPENVLLGPQWFSEATQHDPDHLWSELEALLDDQSELLFRGLSDRIAEAEVDDKPMATSLVVVEPERVRWRRTTSRRGRAQVRCLFELGESAFNLVVTDLAVEETLRQLPLGIHERDAAGFRDDQRLLLTISLGEAFEHHHYKLVAAAIALER